VGNVEVERVRETIMRLPLEFREIILLREYGEFSYQEIAALLDCRPGTVMSRLARARSKLRTLLSYYRPFIVEPAVGLALATKTAWNALHLADPQALSSSVKLRDGQLTTVCCRVEILIDFAVTTSPGSRLVRVGHSARANEPRSKSVTFPASACLM